MAAAPVFDERSDMKKIISDWRIWVLLGLCLAGMTRLSYAEDEQSLRPFVLAATKSGNLPAVVTETKESLAANGFEVVGEYAPYENAYVIVVTSPELKRVAGRTKMGGFGAVQRVGATVAGDQVQLAYTNPRYMANVYRLDGQLEDVADKLAKALGNEQTFGAKGRSADELRNYHYKLFMPYFDEVWQLGTFPNQRAAVKTVERNLAKGVSGTSEVYRVDLPGSDQTLIGVGLTEGCGGDKFIMGTIDAASELKSTPHLPYELLVSNGEVVALHAKFRIAQSFPDLTMLGKGSFWDIKCAPDAIRDSLRAVTGQQSTGE